MTLTEQGLRVERADPSTASDEVLYAIARHHEIMRTERVPEDPALLLDKMVIDMRQPRTDGEAVFFNAWEDDRVVGHVGVFMPLLDNLHLAFLDLSVEAPYRGRGVARDLLSRAADLVGEKGRRRLVTSTNERIPTGEAFARRLGAEAALATHHNQLVVAELDHSLLAGWERDAESRATDYRAWTNVGPYPQDRIEALVEVWNVMNTAPRGDLDMEDWKITPEKMAEWEQNMLATGEQRVATFVDHVPTGRIVAFSELFWQPGRDTLLFQGATAAHPDHRGHGLGRWVKARNLREALARNPEARYVRTGNADSNRWMLAINHAMGFRPFVAYTDWQIELDALRSALAAR